MSNYFVRIQIGLALTLITSACGEMSVQDHRQLSCAAIAVAGLNISVVGQGTLEPESGLVVVAQSDSVEETLVETTPGTYVGAFEKTGQFTLSAVTFHGAQILGTVTVERKKDGCQNIIPVHRTFTYYPVVDKLSRNLITEGQVTGE